MLLGDIIRNLTDESQATATLLHYGELPLLARIEAARVDLTAGAYAAAAVARFADQADDECWVGLMGKIERSDDPAAACLRTMIEWSLKQERSAGCGCGHGHG